jgi:hypothetical protein
VARAATGRELKHEVQAAQESSTGPRVLDMQIPAARNADDVMVAVGQSLHVLLASADALKEHTMRVVGLLAPEQTSAFVTAMLRLHISESYWRVVIF